MCQLARAPSCNSAPRSWRKPSSLRHCAPLQLLLLQRVCAPTHAAHKPPPHKPSPHKPHTRAMFYMRVQNANANANAQVAEWRVPLRGHVQLCSRRGGAAADAAARRAGRRPRSLRRPRRRRSRWPWRRRRRVRTPCPNPRSCFNMLYAESALISGRPFLHSPSTRRMPPCTRAPVNDSPVLEGRGDCGNCRLSLLDPPACRFFQGAGGPGGYGGDQYGRGGGGGYGGPPGGGAGYSGCVRSGVP